MITGSLTSRQYDDYVNDGFYFPLDVLLETDARDHLDRLTAVEAEHGEMHYRVKPYLVFRPAYEAATHPALLDAVESILGPDILLWDSGYVIKEAHSTGYVSWHQDLTYWGLEMESDFDLVSAWLALSPANRGNGGMQFVSGSHKEGRFKHEDTHDDENILHRGQSITDRFDQDRIAHADLNPGQASLHQGWAVHASNPNSSDTRRVGLVINYLKPSAIQVVGARETATLVRGRDRFGHFDTEPEFDTDFAAENLSFQQDVERRKREVYDTA